MLPSDETFLNIIKDTLAYGVAPANSGEPRKLLDSGLRLALGELIYRGGAGTERQRRIHQELHALAARHNELAAQWPASGASKVVAESDAADASKFADLSAHIDRLRGALIAEAPKFAAALADPAAPAAWRSEARAWLVALTRNELDEITRDTAPPPAGDDSSDRVGAHKDALRTSLAKGLGQPDLQIVEHRRVSGGFSRDTFIVTVRAAGRETRYVIRAAVEGSGYLDAIYRSISEEFPLLQLAERHGIPAPKVFFLEEDESVLGSRFILMEHRPGAAVGDTMYAHDQVDIRVFRKLARLLADLHRLPWAQNIEAFPQMKGRTRLTMAEGAQMFLEKNRWWRDSANLRPSAALVLADDWLARNIPENGEEARFIHGDIGFHNMLIDGEEISALLDWEGGAVGNPCWDLVAARLMLDARVSWEEFLGWYVEAGGVRPRDDELEYWLMMRTYSGNLSCTIALERMFESSGKIAYLELGLAARPFYLGHFLESAAKLWESHP